MGSLRNLLICLVIVFTFLIFWCAVYIKNPAKPLQELNAERNLLTTAQEQELDADISGLRVWPEQLHTDRILEQLQLTRTTNSVKKIYATHRSFQATLGGTYFLESQCSVNQCEFVDNLKEADAVVFKDFVHLSRKNVSPDQIWILYVLESPLVSGYVIKDEPAVNWTATYREDSDLVTPYEKWVPYDHISEEEENKIKINYASGKTKKIAWFVSNCAASNRRLQYARELRNYIDVDIYGRCGPLKCNKSTKACDEMLDRDYKFYLAFENANCRDYITEKFFVNGLGHDVIPIVMGAHSDDYRRVAPKHSYIHVDDFPSSRDLADYLNLLDANDDLYNSYFLWKKTGEFINTKFFCRLCAMLHQDHKPKFYKDFKTWWNGEDGNICRKNGWS